MSPAPKRSAADSPPFARRGARRFASLATAAILIFTSAGPAASAFSMPAPLPLQEADRAVNQGRVDQAVDLLHQITAAAPNDGPAHLLLCRAFLSEEMPDRAVPECESALTVLTGSSPAQDWMGHAYGMKASRVSPLAAFVLARKVRDAFQTAVNLDPQNGAAVSDLGEYFVAAPAIVGGGLDKAGTLAQRFSAQLPQQAHRIRAMAAEKAGDRDRAEREFRAAVDVAHRPTAWVDLAAFYSRIGDAARSIEAVRSCVAADPQHDASVVDAASVLDDVHREPQLAEQLLRSYLEGSAQTDAAPAFRVHVMLGKLLLARGEKAAARAEFDGALALASGYAPARTARQSL